MGDDRANSALARIERALARIEAAANRPGAPAGSPDEGLAAAHQALKSKVEDAIGRIDQLLDTAEAG